MNARERLQRIERELNEIRDVVSNGFPEHVYWEIRGAWSRVSGVLADYADELARVEVPEQ